MAAFLKEFALKHPWITLFLAYETLMTPVRIVRLLKTSECDRPTVEITTDDETTEDETK